MHWKCLIGALCVTACYAVQTIDGQERFDVASVRVSSPGLGQRLVHVGTSGGPGTTDPTRYMCENLSLSNLVTIAYDIRYFQLAGPSWMDGERFDINAKVPLGATKQELRGMLRNLLIERFHLKAHLTKRDKPIYYLVVSKGGPKLKVSEAEDSGVVHEVARVAEGADLFAALKTDKDGFPAIPPGRSAMIVANGRARKQASRESMEQLAAFLTNQLGEPVQDGTKLKGKYDFTLSWFAESKAEGSTAATDSGIGHLSTGEISAGPNMFTALRDQLGLNLLRARGKIEFLVIDHADKVPVAN